VDLLARQSCCLSAQEIFDRLRKARRPVGIASVFRALETLVDLRLVKRVDAGDGIARYEPARSNGEHHHHLVCRDCGKVEAFTDPQLERAIDRVADGLGYAIDEHEVVLSGACAACA
jgi:Fur family ferric uptake transcriptional regulator